MMRSNSSLSPLPGPLLRAATFINFCDCLCFLPRPRTMHISCHFWVCTLEAGPDSCHSPSHPVVTVCGLCPPVFSAQCPVASAQGSALVGLWEHVPICARLCLPPPAICIFMFNFRLSGSIVFKCSKAIKSFHALCMVDSKGKSQ